MNRVTTTANGEAFVYDGEEVYREYYDSAGNYHWFGVCTGHHIVRMNEMQMKRIEVVGDERRNYYAYRANG